MEKAPNTTHCAHCETRIKSVFCKANAPDLEAIDEHKNVVVFKKGQEIFNQDAKPHGLYCVSKGKVKVHQLGSEGKDQIVRMAKEGDIIGYRSLLSGDRYACSATALDNTTVCFIPKETFFNVMEANSSITFSVMNLLSNDLGKAEHKLTDINLKPVKERLAEALLFLKETYGFEADNQTLNIVMSREDIASLVGTARETAIRVLSDLKDEQVLVLEGKKIKIINLLELVRIANVFD